MLCSIQAKLFLFQKKSVAWVLMSSQLGSAFPKSWILWGATRFEWQAFQGPDETTAKKLTGLQKYFLDTVTTYIQRLLQGSRANTHVCFPQNKGLPSQFVINKASRVLHLRVSTQVSFELLKGQQVHGAGPAVGTGEAGGNSSPRGRLSRCRNDGSIHLQESQCRT